MQKKTTINDISRELGVTKTTITNVLNNKGRVSEELRQRVLEVCLRENYVPNKAARSMARKVIKIGVVITGNVFGFNNIVLDGAKSACSELQHLRVEGDFNITGIPYNINDFIYRLKNMADAGYDGIIINHASDHEEFYKIFDEIHKKGIALASVISNLDYSNILFSVSHNARYAGKMAAEYLDTVAAGKSVVVFTGGKDFAVHKDNLNGFMEQVKESSIKLASVYEHEDDPDKAYDAATRLYREFPNIGGIYIATANSITICKRLEELGMTERVKIIASDVFPELNEYIRKGVVNATIFQDPFNIGKLAFRSMYEHIEGGKNIKRTILLNPQLVMKSNLDLYETTPYRYEVYL